MTSQSDNLTDPYEGFSDFDRTNSIICMNCKILVAKGALHPPPFTDTSVTFCKPACLIDYAIKCLRQGLILQHEAFRTSTMDLIMEKRKK